MSDRDVDFVVMSDYSADMSALSEQCASIIHRQREEIRNLRQMVGVLIESVGGEIVVHDWRIANMDTLELTVMADQAEGARRFIVKRKGRAA